MFLQTRRAPNHKQARNRRHKHPRPSRAFHSMRLPQRDTPHLLRQENHLALHSGIGNHSAPLVKTNCVKTNLVHWKSRRYGIISKVYFAASPFHWGRPGRSGLAGRGFSFAMESARKASPRRAPTTQLDGPSLPDSTLYTAIFIQPPPGSDIVSQRQRPAHFPKRDRHALQRR
jgi:hypothetical protein